MKKFLTGIISVLTIVFLCSGIYVLYANCISKTDNQKVLEHTKRNVITTTKKITSNIKTTFKNKDVSDDEKNINTSGHSKKNNHNTGSSNNNDINYSSYDVNDYDDSDDVDYTDDDDTDDNDDEPSDIDTDDNPIDIGIDDPGDIDTDEPGDVGIDEPGDVGIDDGSDKGDSSGIATDDEIYKDYSGGNDTDYDIDSSNSDNIEE